MLFYFIFFSSSHFLIISFYFYSWFTCSSLLHPCYDLVSISSYDFKKVFIVYEKTRSQGIASFDLEPERTLHRLRREPHVTQPKTMQHQVDAGQIHDRDEPTGGTEWTEP